MTPDQYCYDKVKRSGSNFYYGFLGFSKERQRALMALYAFCREVDDVVDECQDNHVAYTKLQWWREEINALMGQNRPQHPVSQALQMYVPIYALPYTLFHTILDGMQMDLEKARYACFEDLQLYCHRVAGVVGQLAARIFGYRQDKTLEYAHTLGIAFQLTNMIRDVGEDARRGRIYLPQDELLRFSCSESKLLHYQSDSAFTALMQYQIRRAKHYYQQAFSLLPKEDRRQQRPGLIMAAIYRALLNEIERDGSGNVLYQRLSIPTGRKLWLAGKTWLSTW